MAEIAARPDIDALQRRIEALAAAPRRTAGADRRLPERLSLGPAPIDAALGGGLALRALHEIADVEARMLGVLDALELTELVTTITGLSVVGAAAILAQTGDPARFDCPRTWVKHAGLCPRANESGTFHGTTKVSGRGRPALRTAAWRAIWGALRHNPVYSARFTHLTSRAANPLRAGQARAAIAAALLRQLHVVVTRRVAWDPDIAAGTVWEVAPQAA